MGNYFILFLCSFSSTKTALTMVGEAARYNNSIALVDGLDRVVSFVRYPLRSSNACCCSGPHSNRSVFRRALKNGNPLSADLAMNLFKAGNLPVNLCTCFVFFGGCMFAMAAILCGFGSMPLAETRHPSNLPL